MREATVHQRRVLAIQRVSIHASHAGGDKFSAPCSFREYVSIHASHAGGDNRGYLVAMMDAAFQSTPPMREATTGTGKLPY